VRIAPTLLLVAFALSAQAAQLKPDHVTIAGTDLKRMLAGAQSIGIPTEYGGPHSNHATQMAITSFSDGSYLEFIAPQDNPDPAALHAHAWAKPIEANAGPCAWAIRSQNVATDVRDLKANGVTVHEPVQSGRSRPDGKRLEWETARVGDEPNGMFFPFLIRDITPRQERAFPSGKPTTKDFSGITRVVILVRDLEAGSKRYREAFRLAAPVKQVDAAFGANLAIFIGTPVVLASPLNYQSWLAERLERVGEGPCAFVLGGKKTKRYQTVWKSRWSMSEVSWFDAGKLGWHLGFE
jgi:hypothetical protein